MSTSSRIQFRCSKCGAVYEAEVYSFIDAGQDPRMKQEVLEGSPFVRECPECGNRELVSTPMVYREPGLLVCISDRDISVEGLEGVTGRIVPDASSLIEKVRIFSSGLEDTVIELVKFVTRGELEKDVPLRFLRTEGADNELVFIYPEAGQMHPLAVGFNVYEDCRGILSRNPQITEGLQGLVRVDRAWVEKYLL